MAQSMVGVTRVNIFEPICVVVDAVNTDYKCINLYKWQVLKR